MRLLAAIVLLGLAPPALALGPADCRTVQVTDAGSGRPLSGIEDLVYHPPSGMLILSVQDRWADEDGDDTAPMGLFAVPAADIAGTERALAHRVGPARIGGLPVRPHGIALRDFGQGDWRLAVVDHRAWREETTAEGAPGTAIESYRVAADGSLTLARSAAGVDLCPANDLDWLDENRLIVSLDRWNCGGFRRFLELSLGLWRGRLATVDLNDGRRNVVADDLGFPNGVLVRGEDVFVAFSRENRVARYRFDGDGGLREAASVDLPGGGDNLAAGADGGLLVAVHPDLTAYGLYLLRIWGFDSAPSHFRRIDPVTMQATDLYDDPDGGLFSGATSVIEAAGHYIAGAAFDGGLLVCPADD